MKVQYKNSLPSYSNHLRIHREPGAYQIPYEKLEKIIELLNWHAFPIYLI